MGSNLDSLQKLVVKKAVFVDDETFSKASLSSQQARTIKALEQRVETLEREVDAAITAAARARSDKRQAEVAQRAAELNALEVTRELENTTNAKLNTAVQLSTPSPTHETGQHRVPYPSKLGENLAKLQLCELILAKLQEPWIADSLLAHCVRNHY
ncbi:hypothetical protein IFM89_011726 [Coptis chinensis]|uniref:Uncharacterized protein n=1 Tax=Coptis chinensis TaxID=261450 RepID=A0A835IXP7_9MAGN|nr:hypothetical protein IFM89_011726 [Coptis chinensis]